MKRVLLIIILIMIAMALSASILSDVDQAIKDATGIVISLGALLTAIIALYWQYKEGLKNDANAALRDPALGLIVKAKDNPLDILNSLNNKPIINLVARPDESRRDIVAQALLEKEDNKPFLKRLKINDLISAGSFVSQVYQGSKTLIKMIGK